MKLIAPNGKEITGTLEVVHGRGAIAEGSIRRNPETGKLEFEYGGGTDMFWDEQRPVTRDGKTVFLDEDGNDWTEDQVTLETPG